MEFINKHKQGFIITIIIVILLILIGLVINIMFLPNSNKDGDRLKDAPNISEESINKIKDSFKANKFVIDANYSINSVTMKFFVDVKPETKIEDSQSLSSLIINNLDEKIVKFYDIEFYITQKEGKDTNYPMIGYHSKKSDSFNWVINKGEPNEE